jgi:hypothetical protein
MPRLRKVLPGIVFRLPTVIQLRSGLFIVVSERKELSASTLTHAHVGTCNVHGHVMTQTAFQIGTGESERLRSLLPLTRESPPRLHEARNGSSVLYPG